MPIVSFDENTVLPERSTYDMQVERDPTFGELSKAYFENENLISNVANKFAQPKFDEDPDYDVFEDQAVTEGYVGHLNRFIDVKSRAEAQRVMENINQENENKATIASGGVEGAAVGVLSGIIDPANFVPIGGAAYKTYRTGGRILEGAARTSLVVGTATAVEELALQNMQETRTAEESLWNIGGATFLSGVIGGAASAFGGKAELAALSKRVEDSLTVPYGAYGGSTVGAAATSTTTLADETLKSAAGLEKLLSFQDPTLRMMNSPSVATRKLGGLLYETTLVTNKNTKGIASDVSVENRIKGYELPKYLYVQERDKQFLEYRQSKSKLLTATVDNTYGRARKDGMLTYQEFKEEITKALRRGDQHEIPQVAAAAAARRRLVLDPIFNEAKSVKLIDADVTAPKTAISYVNRMWDSRKIVADRRRFQDVNETWLRKKRDDDVVNYQNFIKENEAKLKEIEIARATKDAKITDAMIKLEDELDELRYRAQQDDEQISDIAYQLTDRVLGTSVGRLNYDGKIPSGKSRASPGKRGPAKERVYDIPDEMVEDFLINDDDVLLEGYTRSLGSDIELMRTYGTIDPESKLKEIQDDYAKLEHGVNDPKVLEKIRQAKNADLRDFKAVWERLRGTYGNNGTDDYASGWRSAERTIMNANYVSMLGGMTVSAFTDVARPVMVHGMTRFLGDGLGAALLDWKGFSAAAKDVLESGTALDMVLNTRGKAIYGLDEIAPFINKAEAVTGAMANNFGVVSLMAPWNASAKQFVGVMTQSRMLRAINKLAEGREISAKEIEYLAANFIDVDMAKRIAGQFASHGEKTDRVYVPNARKWDDRGAQETFRAAVRRDVDRTIVTPGQDKPLWMSKPGLKLMGQFRSFAMASTQRTTLAALQQRDMAVLNGVALSMTLGSMTYVIKSKAAGYEPNYDTKNLLIEGFDRSGLTGWLMDANNIVEKVSRGRVGMNALMGGPPMSRYASRSALEAVFGPTYGMLGNAVQITGNAFAGDWKETDTHTVRRMMPYQNLIYVRSIFDEAETNINEFFGVD